MLNALYAVAMAFLLCAAALRWRTVAANKAAVLEALEKLRAEMEQESPRLMCLMVKSPTTLISRDAQKVIWTLQSFESKDWQDNDVLTLTKSRKTSS
jgi:hypothetical protein